MVSLVSPTVSTPSIVLEAQTEVVFEVGEPGVGFDGEVSQGKLLVDAAKAMGVKHFVWSTLDSSPYKAAHWESKDRVDKYLKESGVGRTS
jgi:NmrA-like family